MIKLSDLVVTRYCLNEKHRVNLELRSRPGDAIEQWAIVYGADCLNKRGMYEYEPMPSNRTEKFLERCRWSSAKEALAFWEEHIKNNQL